MQHSQSPALAQRNRSAISQSLSTHPISSKGKRFTPEEDNELQEVYVL